MFFVLLATSTCLSLVGGWSFFLWHLYNNMKKDVRARTEMLMKLGQGLTSTLLVLSSRIEENEDALAASLGSMGERLEGLMKAHMEELQAIRGEYERSLAGEAFWKRGFQAGRAHGEHQFGKVLDRLRGSSNELHHIHDIEVTGAQVYSES